MAITKTWGYSSDTASSSTVTMSVIDPVSGFALVEDEPERCSMVNSSSLLDAEERLSYLAQKVDNVPTYLDNQYPAPVKSGVQYVVRLDEQLLLTSTDEASFKEVLPVVAYLTIRHPKNGSITASDIDTIFKRLVGACYKDHNGTITSRFADLMKSALRPTEDGANPPS